jgi:phage gp16-like protein
MTIGQLKAKYERLDTDVVAVQSLEAEKETMVGYQQAQMYSGEDSQGGSITPAYTPLTRFLKQEKGQPNDRVTLRDTGEFYAAMYTEVSKTAVKYSSKDYKTQKLVKKYGEEIFGLNTPMRSHFIQTNLKPTFMGIIRRELR